MRNNPELSPGISGPRPKTPEDANGNMKYMKYMGEMRNRVPTKSASCMARFMKDMQVCNMGRGDAKTMIIAHCFIRKCRKTQVVNHEVNDHGMCKRAQFDDSVCKVTVKS